MQKKYSYILELDDGGNIIGGEWSAQSREQHPDFAWIALEPRQGNGLYNSGNPFVDVDTVLDLWAKSVGYDSYEEAPPAFAFNDEFKDWGKFTKYSMRLNGHHHGTSFSGEDSIFSIDLDEQYLPQTIVNGGLNVFYWTEVSEFTLQLVLKAA